MLAKKIIEFVLGEERKKETLLESSYFLQNTDSVQLSMEIVLAMKFSASPSSYSSPEPML